MKIVFMGTPEYALPTLQALIDSKHEVLAVYTKPDLPKGRGKKVEITPIKALALDHQLPVFQPLNFQSAEAIDQFKNHEADVAVVIAYGLILPAPVLEAYHFGAINLHASLLPKFRGASPIQAAILAGEGKTGVTSMQMDTGLDTGNILLKSEILLKGNETGGYLHDCLAGISADLCLATLEALAEGGLEPVVQAKDKASYAGKISKDMGRIVWSRLPVEIDRQVRAMNPWPSAYTYWQGKLLKIWQAQALPGDRPMARAGQVINISNEGIEVACGKGSLLITQVQLEGKKRMAIQDFLNGHTLELGQVFKAE